MIDMQAGELTAIDALRTALDATALLGFGKRDHRGAALQAKAAFVGQSAADLSVTNTPSTTTPAVGSNVTFTVVVRNNSAPDNTVFNQVVNDSVPTGTTYVSSSTTAGSTYNQATGV